MINVNVVNGGDFAADALLYKQPSATLMNYLNDNINSIVTTTANLSNTFINSVKNMYNKAYDATVLTASKLLLNTVGYSGDQNALYTYHYGSDIQPTLVMQEYIMANPIVDKLYQRNMCFGYMDTYKDPEPDTTGEERLVYQRVMDGVLQFDNEGNGYVKHYSNRDDIELSIVDKLSVLDTWDTVARYIAEGIDPTDPDKGEL